MEHYSLDKWADFARQVIGEQERAEMQSHLENDGCTKCSEVLGLWQRVQDVARHEHSYQPPDSVVRSIKGTFALHGPRRAGRAALAVAELLFDSARNPLPAGVRSTGTALRQLLYGAGNYRIDVRIEPQPDSRKVAVVGQVLNSAEPDEAIGVAPVSLVRGGKVLATSVTSPFGEFDVECDLGGPLELSVQLPAKELRLPLTEPILRDVTEHLEISDSKGVRKPPRRIRKRTRTKV